VHLGIVSQAILRRYKVKGFCFAQAHGVLMLEILCVKNLQKTVDFPFE
jgi:hypothetical protein